MQYGEDRIWLEEDINTNKHTNKPTARKTYSCTGVSPPSDLMNRTRVPWKMYRSPYLPLCYCVLKICVFLTSTFILCAATYIRPLLPPYGQTAVLKWYDNVCVCMYVCVCVCGDACMHACVRVCMPACVCLLWNSMEWTDIWICQHSAHS